MSTQAKVAEIPTCQINAAHGAAYADAKLRANAGRWTGTWAFVCRMDFDYHDCRLGTGLGQELVLAND